MVQKFPYEELESLFSAANHIIAAIMELPQRDWAEDVQDAVRLVDAIGRDNGFGWPAMPEERAVSSVLKKMFCGPRTAQYGWRLYGRYIRDGKWDLEGVSY